MTNVEILASSLQQFGLDSRAANTPEQLYLAMYKHAFVSSMALNPKQSRNGIKANWNCKFATKPSTDSQGG